MSRSKGEMKCLRNLYVLPIYKNKQKAGFPKINSYDHEHTCPKKPEYIPKARLLDLLGHVPYKNMFST